MRALTATNCGAPGLDVAAEMAAVSIASKTAAGPSVADDETWAPINGRGWVTVTRAGQAALARSHPLTFEGERIGTFDLYLACGNAPDTFALTYRELRTGPAESRAAAQHHPGGAGSSTTSSSRSRSARRKKRTRRGEMESIANAVLPARLVRALASDNPASMTLETDSIGNPRTMIRVGNAGFGRSFRELERAAASRSASAGTPGAGAVVARMERAAAQSGEKPHRMALPAPELRCARSIRATPSPPFFRFGA